MYSFENLKKDIFSGREVEFIYKDNKYSISSTRDGKVFTKFNNSDNDVVFNDQNDFEILSIDNRLLKDIFNNNEIKDLIIF